MTIRTIYYLDGPSKNLCGKCSNSKRNSTERTNPTTGYNINWTPGVTCEDPKHR